MGPILWSERKGEEQVWDVGYGMGFFKGDESEMTFSKVMGWSLIHVGSLKSGFA